MKRMLPLFLALILTFSLTACNASHSNSPDTLPDNNAAIPPVDNAPVDSPEDAGNDAENDTANELPAPTDLASLDLDIEFSGLLEEISTAREQMYATEPDFSEAYQWLVNDPETENILSDEEVLALNTRVQQKDNVTYEQAVSDIDLFFRAMKGAYCAYYYFGEDQFQQAKGSVMN